MGNEQLEAEVKQLEERERVLREQMEAAAKQFFPLAEQFVSQSINELVRRVVVQCAEVTKSLGPEKLSALKADLAATLARVPDLVKMTLDRNDVWLHRRNWSPSSDIWELQSPHVGTKHSPPKGADESIRKILFNAVTDLVRRHGYTNLTDVGFDISRGILYVQLPWNPEMQAPLIQYEAWAKELIEVVQKLRYSRRNRDESAAKDLWDKA